MKSVRPRMPRKMRWSAGAGTIAYELLCNVKRVPRVYENVSMLSSKTALT